ncbi:MAG: TrmH family RNA methyltransferase [Lentisphaeria bacterium]|nr:TrmH family RNA methyltransferase [Lentisphaeria bacterium]
MKEVPEVLTGDQGLDFTYTCKHDVVFVLDRLRSAHNVGNVFRIAELTAIREVLTCGYTATPPHAKLEKTAMGCDAVVPFRHFETGVSAVKSLQADGYRVLAVETVADAPMVWDCNIQPKTAFVFGNEALGITEEALAACDGFVRLPVFGFKNSLNVGNCASVIAYEAVRQLGDL